MVRGGRLTKYKGKIVSLAPMMGQLTGFILPVALGAALMIGSVTMTGSTARAGVKEEDPPRFRKLDSFWIL